MVRLTDMGGARRSSVFELVLRLKQICTTGHGRSAKLERLEADLEEVASSGRSDRVQPMGERSEALWLSGSAPWVSRPRPVDPSRQDHQPLPQAPIAT